jgi:hypothetical protein
VRNRRAEARLGTWILTALAWMLCASDTLPAHAADPRYLYATGFELSEGYDPNLTLLGQNGWIGYGSGGSGLVTNFFAGEGQQAFIGFAPPTNAVDSFSLWRPVNLVPATNTLPVVRFSVLMSIEPGTSTTRRDDFRWSAYNIDGRRLFTIDFDGVTHDVGYGLDDGAGISPAGGVKFADSTAYELVVWMNFQRNLWTAAINHLTVIHAKPITTTNSALTFGDMDAVWAIRTPESPGDNYMLFDNYELRSEPFPSMPPVLEPLAYVPNQGFLVRLFGEPGFGYALESSSDVTTWTPIKTNGAPDGVIDFFDSTAALSGLRFYRARHVP